MRIARVWSLGIALIALGGCHSGSSGPPPLKDAAVYDLSIDLPPGCPPPQPNEKGVGIPCTRGGGECTRAGVPKGLLCTCDPLPVLNILLDGVPCVCTIGGPNLTTNPDPCTANGVACGSDATCCPYMTSAFYCSPNVCLPGGACINFTPADGG